MKTSPPTELPPRPHIHEPTSLDTRRDINRPRQIFVNRNLRLDKVDLVGFDMDHTLAVYRKRVSEELAFEMTLSRLISERGYPTAVGRIKYDPAFVVRGLVIDKVTGNIVKADRHNHIGRAFHGRRRLTSDERKTLYRGEKIRLGAERWAWIDTLFALPEACLYAFIVAELEDLGEKVDFRRLYDDIRATIDAVHRDGSLKAELQKDIGRFIVRDEEIGPALHKLRSAGKKLFLATNSYWDYTDHVMTYMLDGVVAEYPRWTKYFDYVVVGAQKPAFFAENRPFLELDAKGSVVGEARSLERGRVYQGGNVTDFERHTGIGGERVLYVGDHIYGDILRSRKHSLWRTCMVVEELEDEIAHRLRHAEDFERLHALERSRARLDDELNQAKIAVAGLDKRLERTPPGEARDRVEATWREEKAHLEALRRQAREADDGLEALETIVEASYNPYWGFAFKEGPETSRFGEQVEDYACLYTSRAANLLYYSPLQYFRSPREIMPHEMFL